MNAGIVVQARFSSARLPGKVLRPLAGRPLLSWTLESLASAGFARTVVAAGSICGPGGDTISPNGNAYLQFAQSCGAANGSVSGDIRRLSPFF